MRNEGDQEQEMNTSPKIPATSGRSPIFILDGGLGTSLEDEHGIKFDSATTPLWSSHLLLSDPETLLSCHCGFAEAGADVIETATYQMSIEGFRRTHLGKELSEEAAKQRILLLLADAVRIARSAHTNAGPTTSALVALSLGPYGACMIPSQEYSGRYDAEHDGKKELWQWHSERLGLFTAVDGLMDEIDLIAFETIPRVDEIIAIRQLMKTVPGPFASPDGQKLVRKRYWISCLYPGDEDALPDGNGPKKAIEAMLSLKYSDIVPWGIGINCTKIAKLPSVVKKYETAVSAMVADGRLEGWPSLVLYPDGTNGEIYNTTTQMWEPPEGQGTPVGTWETQLASIAKAAASRGAWRSILVGGCCKASPRHIQTLREAIHTV